MKKGEAKRIFADTFLEVSKSTPIDRITVKEIVKRSGLSKQSFYNCFDTKADMVLWIHKGETERLIARVGSDGYTLRDFLTDIIGFWFDHKAFWVNAIKHTNGNELFLFTSSRNTYDTVSDYLKKKLGAIPPTDDFSLRAFIYGIGSMLAYWALRKNDFTKQSFLDMTFASMPENLKPYFGIQCCGRQSAGDAK